MHELAAVQADIRSCTSCFPDGGNRPVAYGPAEAKAMVIGQAPSLTDAQTGRAFSGPGGRRLRDWFQRAGLQDEDVYLSALTKCYPGPSRNGKGDRTPSRREISSCRQHLLRELSILQPRIILLVGGMAIREFLGAGPLAGFVGGSFDACRVDPFSSALTHAASARIVPLPHCSGASLWLNDTDHRELLDRALAHVAELLTDADHE